MNAYCRASQFLLPQLRWIPEKIPSTSHPLLTLVAVPKPPARADAPCGSPRTTAVRKQVGKVHTSLSPTLSCAAERCHLKRVQQTSHPNLTTLPALSQLLCPADPSWDQVPFWLESSILSHFYLLSASVPTLMASLHQLMLCKVTVFAVSRGDPPLALDSFLVLCWWYVLLVD